MTERGVFKMSTIAKRSGFNPAVLRAWERRHALLEPERTAGGHRLYTETDLRVLQRVSALLEEGRAIGEIASMGRTRLLATGPQPPSPVKLELTSEESSRLEEDTRRLVEAAVQVDGHAVERALDDAFSAVSPTVALNRVVLPALETIGELWASGRCGVAGEHLASGKVVGRLRQLLQAANPSANNGARAAICACLPDEQHEIGALLSAYTLARHYYRVTYLGASLPLEDLEQACTLLRPQVVCLSVARTSLLMTHKPRLLEMAGRLPLDTTLLLGGRGVEQPDPELEDAGVLLLHPQGKSLLEELRGGVERPGARRRPAAKKARGKGKKKT